MDWIDLAQERNQRRGLGEHGNVSSGSIKNFGNFWRLIRKGISSWSYGC
jgi:hypothetical protein